MLAKHWCGRFKMYCLALKNVAAVWTPCMTWCWFLKVCPCSMHGQGTLVFETFLGTSSCGSQALWGATALSMKPSKAMILADLTSSILQTYLASVPALGPTTRLDCVFMFFLVFVDLLGD